MRTAEIPELRPDKAINEAVIPQYSVAGHYVLTCAALVPLWLRIDHYGIAPTTMPLHRPLWHRIDH